MLSLIYQTWDLFTKVLLNLVGEELLFIPIAEECFARVLREWG